MSNEISTEKRIENERKFWNKIANNYDKPSQLDLAYKLSIQKCKEIIKANEKVIEIACGTGKISLEVAENAESVVGLDISEKMIDVATNKKKEKMINNIVFEVGDGYCTKFDNASFDVVMLFNCIHIVQDPQKLLSEAYRLLKLNGYLITATDCYSEKLPLAKKIYSTVPKLMKRLGAIKYLNCFTKIDLETLIKNNNFTILQTDILYNAPINYFICSKKR